MREDLIKIGNHALTCLGYGFKGRDTFLQSELEEFKGGEREFVSRIVGGYLIEKKMDLSTEATNNLVDKIIETKGDIKQFVEWINKDIKN